MLSFTVLDRENKDATLEMLGKLITDTEFLSEIVESFLDFSEDGVEVGLSATEGVLLVRVLDGGRYSFVYPIEIDEGADVDLSLLEISRYAMRELIPIYLTDCPRDELSRIGRLFLHFDARAYEEDEDSFVVSINSECDLIAEIPTFASGKIVIGEIGDEDVADYAAICRSTEVNKYWGFDDLSDYPDCEDGYFLSLARSEMARGVALSLAVRLSGRMVGEAVLFDFDYRGGAMAAIRLMSEAQGRGIGSTALGLLISLARDIGLKKLYAEVMVENLASIRMTEKQMNFVGEADGIKRFELDLTK